MRRRSVRTSADYGPGQVGQLAARADRFDPAEDLFDQLAPALAAAVAGRPRCATAYRGAADLFALSDVRRYSQAAQVPDEVAHVVGSVGTDRSGPLTPRWSIATAA